MAVFVRNVLRMDGVSFLDLFTKEGEFDFEKIIPMPPEIFRGNLGPEEELKYGKNNWFDWSIEHWGTKWNAEETEIIDDNTVRFDTAYNAPIKIFDALGKMFPDKVFSVIWASEDCGNYTGQYKHSLRKNAVIRHKDEGKSAIAAYEYCWNRN